MQVCTRCCIPVIARFRCYQYSTFHKYLFQIVDDFSIADVTVIAYSSDTNMKKVNYIYSYHHSLGEDNLIIISAYTSTCHRGGGGGSSVYPSEFYPSAR